MQALKKKKKKTAIRSKVETLEAGIQNHFCCLHYLINKFNIKLQATKSDLMLR